VQFVPNRILFTKGENPRSEENKALDRRIYEEVWGAFNLDNVEKYYAADYVDHIAFPGLPPGREGVKATVNMFASAWSDLKLVIEDQIAGGDKVVTRWSTTATHTGELLGIPATGKQIKVTGIGISRFEGGKVVESWTEYDSIGMMQQLGVVPPPGG
jgi:steroid delta-isomerase-like uncharacterized protein